MRKSDSPNQITPIAVIFRKNFGSKNDEKTQKVNVFWPPCKSFLDLAMSKFFNKSLTVNPLFGFWIGLVAYNSTYNWEWLDGTPVNYFNWGAEAPNAYRYQDFPLAQLGAMLTPGGETATKLWRSDRRWSDYWTGFYQVGYICIKNSNIIKNISQDYIVVQPNYNYTGCFSKKILIIVN